MRRPRDNQRSRLYAAERAAWACYDPEPEMSWPEVKKFVFKVCHNLKQDVPLLGQGQGARRAFVSFGGSRMVLPRWARKKTVILHELAHIISPDHHGPIFAKNYVSLIKRFIGSTEAAIMRMAYKQYRVKLRIGCKP